MEESRVKAERGKAGGAANRPNGRAGSSDPVADADNMITLRPPAWSPGASGDKPDNATAQLPTPHPLLDVPSAALPGSSTSIRAIRSELYIRGRLAAGEVIDHYQLVRRLGKGGMGEVWLGHDLNLGSDCALKFILDAHSVNADFHKRFTREARVMRLLDHPHGVRVYDYRISTDDVPFIVMEHITGRPLDLVIKEREDLEIPAGEIDWEDRVRYADTVLTQICDFLFEAHQKRVYHRDLKPSNLMIEEGRRGADVFVRVLDFGIAKVVDTDANDVRTSMGRWGTDAYSSPEQIQDAGTVDHRSDIYSLGVVLYEILLGRRPFLGRNVVYQHLIEPPPPFAEAVPGCSIPEPIEAVVRRCLEKDPAKRPQTAQELAQEFSAALKLVYPDPEPVEAGPRRRGSGPLLVAVAAVCVAAGAAISFFPRGDGGEKGGGPEVVTNDPPKLPALPPHVEWSRGGKTFLEFEGPKGTYSLPKGYRPADADFAEDGHAARVLRDSDRTLFVRIAGGTMKVGNPEAQIGDPDFPREVTVEGFYLQQTEATNAELASFLEAPDAPKNKAAETFLNQYEAARRDADEGVRVDAYPAVWVDFGLALAYAGHVAGNLPTDIQWRFAASSRGKPRRFVWQGDDAPEALRKGKVNVDLGDVQRRLRRSSAESLDATEQDVREMGGNAREWCLATDDQGAVTDRPAVCGGSFDQPPIEIGIVDRGEAPVRKDSGFRVVLTTPSQ